MAANMAGKGQVLALAPAGARVPEHVAIIMDGNGRWAKQRGLPRLAGHRQGAESVRAVVKASLELGIRHLTFFAFSTENWKRPRAEVNGLMQLLRLYVREEADALKEQGIRVRFAGERMPLAPALQRMMGALEAETQNNDRLHLHLAVNYGSRAAIAAVARALAWRVARGEIAPSAIDEETLGQALRGADVPDPDLLIRTSGEQRISNFLLWELAYSELVFSDVLWPDFDRAAFEAALDTYDRRERRYGALAG